MASFLQRLFKPRKEPANIDRVEVMSGGPVCFVPFDGDAYSSDIYRAAVDAIARNAAKLKGTHVITLPGQQRKDGDASLNRILQVRPNRYMTAYDMIYKLVTHYYLYNNAFAYLQKDERGNLLGIWPLRPQSMEFLTDPTGILYCRFLFSGGRTYILPYSEVFHIRRHFNGNDLLGDPNTAISPILNLACVQTQGMEAAIKSSATIRGLLKFNQVLSPERLRAERDGFVSDYLAITNAGGIAVLDSKADYTPLKNEPYIIDDKQLQAIKNKIFQYLGVSEAIIANTYDENTWSAFFSGTLEPLSIQFSQELTSKIFTERERGFGNQIIFSANRLTYASNQTKISMAEKLLPTGLFTINEMREIFELEPVEGGDKRIVSLNYVDSEIANQYQLGNNFKKQDNKGAAT